MKKIAMIMGGHPIDTIGIYPVLRKIEGIEIYPQPLDCFLYDFSGTNNQYDGYFFYCMPRRRRIRTKHLEICQKNLGIHFIA